MWIGLYDRASEQSLEPSKSGMRSRRSGPIPTRSERLSHFKPDNVKLKTLPPSTVRVASYKALSPEPSAQVNAAVDDVAAMGEANLKLMSAVRSNSRSLPTAERKRGQTLLHSISVGPQSRQSGLFHQVPRSSIFAVSVLRQKHVHVRKRQHSTGLPF